MNIKVNNKPNRKKYSREFNLRLPIKIPVDSARVAQDQLIEISNQNNQDMDLIYNFSHEISYSPTHKNSTIRRTNNIIMNKSTQRILNNHDLLSKYQVESILTKANQIIYKKIKERMISSANNFQSQTDYRIKKKDRERQLYQNFEKVPLNSTEFIIMDSIVQKQRVNNPFRVTTARSINNIPDRHKEKSSKVNKIIKRQSKQSKESNNTVLLYQRSNPLNIQGSKFRLGLDQILNKNNQFFYNKIRQRFLFKDRIHHNLGNSSHFKQLSAYSKGL